MAHSPPLEGELVVKRYLINGFAGAFEPEDVELLGVALADAWKTVQDSGAYLDGNAEKARDILAKHIIKEALEGKRDLRELRDNALVQFSQEFRLPVASGN